ncbi:signal recognition particle-docking protein FtsY [Breoghania sp.]|uniref:signal recognition particle-docking protein FtsY n=1 Tax=Breoghania sp. TaxID=2065378 RepID=UPI00261CF0F2|nr:signal recognition particle-docking protein FtsY [Breoghania sp.]MDJ0930467.1 signal recognition particle-docking protein FtsY [Breoghania sp.]
MAESEKRGFFGRLFGGKKDTPTENPEALTPETETPESETPEAETPELETHEPDTAPEEDGIDAPQPEEPTPDETAETEEPVEPEPVEDDSATLEAPQSGEVPAPEAEAAPVSTEEQVPETDVAGTAPEADAQSDVTEPEVEAEIPDEVTNEAAETEISTEEPETAEAVPADETTPKRSWFQRLRDGLSRSSSALGEGITSVFRKRKLDAETLEDLENLLIQADLGTDTAITITERLAEGRFDKEISEEEVRSVLADEIEKVLEPVAQPLDLDTGHKPHVVLLVGVNGTGKTTTIGKLAAKLTREGKKVMLAAGDTFRAAAVEQLKIWGDRTNSTVVSRPTGADAAGLVFDAMKQAQAEQSDVLLIDTAGRLQNRAELMAELEKVVRVIKKHDPEAPHTVLLTLDATTGQNAMSQVEIFGKKAGVTGLVMTKLDGTARGGILVAIAAKHPMPVHFIGIGEGIDDLEPFTAKDFAAAIAGMTQS